MKKCKKYAMWLPFLAALLFFYFLYSYAFPQGDDFTFVAYGRTLPRIWKYYVYYYTVAGSRTANLFAQVLLLADLSVWKLLTPLVAQGVALLLFYCVTGRLRPREDRAGRDFSLACVCAFFPGLVPVTYHLFGDTFLWMDGSCNYLYPLFFLLLGFLPFWNTLRGRSVPRALRLVSPIFLVAAGLMHEQMAAAAFVLAVASLFLLHKEGSPRLLKVLTVLSGVVLVFVLTCPGAYYRLHTTQFGQKGSFQHRLCVSAFQYFGALTSGLAAAVLVLGLCALYCLYCTRVRGRGLLSVLTAAGCVLTALAQNVPACSLLTKAVTSQLRGKLLLSVWLLYFLVLLIDFCVTARQKKRWRWLPAVYLCICGSQAIPAVLGGVGRPMLPVAVLTLLMALGILDETHLPKVQVPAELVTAALAVTMLLFAVAPVQHNSAAYCQVAQQVTAAKAGRSSTVTFDQSRFNTNYCYSHSFTSAYRWEIQQYYSLPARIKILFLK